MHNEGSVISMIGFFRTDIERHLFIQKLDLITIFILVWMDWGNQVLYFL